MTQDCSDLLGTTRQRRVDGAPNVPEESHQVPPIRLQICFGSKAVGVYFTVVIAIVNLIQTNTQCFFEIDLAKTFHMEFYS